jgi:putative transposase
MLVIEAKLKGTCSQYAKLDEAIRTGQFIRNSCLRYWEENQGVTRNDQGFALEGRGLLCFYD